MSQEQPRRPQSEQGPVRYGDVFDVRSNLASKPIAPGDAASMQSAENQVLGATQGSGPAAVMQSAETVYERRGAVSPDDVTDVVRNLGVTVSETNIGGGTRVVTERVGEEIVGQFVDPGVTVDASPAAAAGLPLDITIGEALEATAYSPAGDKPIDQSDAAAIKAAEVRALRSNRTTAGGIGAQAQSAADSNPRVTGDENKTVLFDVLSDATAQLPVDRPVRREDAEGVISAELRNKPDMMKTTPSGVAANMAAAARLNQNP